MVEVGVKVNMLTPIKHVGRIYDKTKDTYWEVQCECGKVFFVKTCRLNPSNPDCYTSCGCHARTDHGLINDPLYNVWRNEKRRCFNPDNQDYHHYGGRGITMYEPWIHDFAAYHAYVSKLPGYEKGLQVDRIDNNGNYEPGNLRFVTSLVNNRNRRDTRYFEWEGITLPLYEIIEKFDYQKLGEVNITTRMRRGFSLQEAINTPFGRKRRTSVRGVIDG